MKLEKKYLYPELTYPFFDENGNLAAGDYKRNSKGNIFFHRFQFGRLPSGQFKKDF